jgi:hypothetical protein
MVKKLRFSRIDLAERVGALLLVTFLDDDGNMYQWAPKWADVEELLPKVAAIERFNKPESEWLNKFAKTVQSVVEGAQRITNARKIEGIFDSYNNEKLSIGIGYYTPGFEVTLSFLDAWLGRSVNALLVNDMVIRLRVYGTDEAGEIEVEDYPPPLANEND